MRADFPSPDHDHARCSADVLSHAETLADQQQAVRLVEVLHGERRA